MPRVSFLLSLAALVPAGCATQTTASRALPELSVASLSAPGEAPAEATAATGWSGVKLDGAPRARRDQDPYDPDSSPKKFHLTLMLGERALDEDEWEPFDSPTVYGVELDETSPTSGNGIEAGVFYTNDEDDDAAIGIAGDVEVTTYEFYGGVRHTFRPGQGGLHPFVSAGIEANHGRAKLSAPGFKDSDGNLVVGAYARAGLLWDVTDQVRLGLDYRYFVGEDLELFDADLRTDYSQVTFSLGFAF